MRPRWDEIYPELREICMYDAREAIHFETLIKRERWSAYVYSPLKIIIGIGFPLLAAWGIGRLISSIRTLRFYIWAIEKFPTMDDPLTFHLLDEELIVKRKEEVVCSLPWANILELSFIELPRRFALEFTTSNSPTCTVIDLRPQEWCSQIVPLLIFNIDRRLPLAAKRNYQQSNKEEMREHDWRRSRNAAVYGGSSLVLTIIIVIGLTFLPVSENWFMPLFLASIISGSLFLLGLEGLRKYRKRISKVFPIEGLGQILSRFEPDRTQIARLRGLRLIVAFFSAILIASILPSTGTTAIAFIIGCAAVIYCIWVTRLIWEEQLTVVFTDQYIILERRSHRLAWRHGHYYFIECANLFGLMFPWPKNSITLAQHGTIRILNRVNETGVLFNWLVRLNVDADRMQRSI